MEAIEDEKLDFQTYLWPWPSTVFLTFSKLAGPILNHSVETKRQKYQKFLIAINKLHKLSIIVKENQIWSWRMQ